MPHFKAAGAFTALATPFNADGSAIDWSAYEQLINGQIAGRISGLVPCGTTGEAPTLSEREQVELIGATAKQARGQASVLAGVGTNSTSKAVALAKAAVEAGADAVMVVMPYYNRPNQQGLIEHTSAVASAIEVPVVLYNVPTRTAVSLSVDTTLAILDRCQNVVAVKDASNNVHYCQELLSRAAGRVQVLSGDDALTLALMALGASGVISVTSNVLPGLVAQLVELWRSGKHAEALELHYRLLPVHTAMFCAPSPVPVKVALHARGVMTDSVRPPLVPATTEERAKVLAALAKIEGQ
jgi:4-hydroxy-tetrahydrodipicolinate synthase